MPILTYHTRVDVGEPAVISGGTSFSQSAELPGYLITGGFLTTLYETRHNLIGNTSYVHGTSRSTRRFTGENSTITYTQDSTREQVVKIDSYGSTAVTLQSRTTRYREVYEYVLPNTSALSTSYSHSCIFGATEVEAFGTVNNVLQYSFSRTFRNDDTEGFSSTVAGGNAKSWTTSTAVASGTSSSTSYTSSAGRFFEQTYRNNVSTTANTTLTQRYVTSSSTRTHTLTYGGSFTYTYTTTVNPAFTIIVTVTRTSTSFPGSQSVTVTQRVPVTTTRTTSRTRSWYALSGPHFHFSANPQTVYGNLLVHDDLTTTAQQIALAASTTGYQYASQQLAAGTGYSTTFSFVYGEVGGSTFGQPSGSTGELTLVHDSYSPTGATGSFSMLSRAFQGAPGSWQIVGANYSEARAVLTPVTITQTTGQTFATQTTSSSSGISGNNSYTFSTTFGYVTATGMSTLSSTIAKTLWEALGTTTSSRTMRLLVTSNSNTTIFRSFTLGSTSSAKTSGSAPFSEISVVHGTVDRAFYNRTTSFAEHAANVPANRFSQQVLIGPFLHSPSATHVYNSMDSVLMFSLSSYAAHDGNLPESPIGFIPLSGTTLHSSTYYTQAYSISSNSTSLSFTSRAASAAATQTSTSSHLKTMANTVARVTIHGNNHSATLDSIPVRSFPSGTGGAYSTSSSQAHLMETPSFVPSAIHGTAGLNGTAGYNLEHDLVYGSGTAGSIRNASTGTSAFPVSRSLASQRIFYGRLITANAAWSDAVPAFSEININPMVTVAPQ